MFTIAFCLSFLSVYGLYALSDRVEIEKKGIMLLLKDHKTLTRLLAGSTLMVSTLIFSTQMGAAVGILTSFMLWTVLACFFILFIPFDKVRWPHVAIVIMLIIAIEMSVPTI
jgi:hypothetical protein